MNAVLFTVTQPLLHLPAMRGVNERRLLVNFRSAPTVSREFSDHALYPPGTATFDSAFFMHNLPHSWHARGRLKLWKQQAL